jgi:transposase InsO family protein
VPLCKLYTGSTVYSSRVGLVINAEKCLFAATAVEFLGPKVSAAGDEPLRIHVQAVLAHPEPTNISELQAFLGTVNFYRRFLPAAARTLKLLTDLLIGGLKGTEPVSLAEPQRAAFVAAKDALAAAKCLAHPSQGFQLSLMVDASADHIGGALQQRRRPADPWQPLGYFSRKLDSTQVKYSAFDRELLACFHAICHFRFRLEGRRFTLYTDHKQHTTAVRRSTEPWTAKQCRQLAYISEFTSYIQHIVGSDNVVADTLSRPPGGAAASSGSESPPRGTVRADRGDKDKIKLSTSSGGLRTPVEALPEVNAVRATPAAVHYAALATHQAACPLTQRAASSTSLQIEKGVVGSMELLCDISRGGVRPLVPLVDRPAVFAAFHELAHAGTRATKGLIATRVMWRSLNSDVAAWVKNCQQCERAKASRQHTAAVQPIGIPARRFTHIHVDIVGPLPAATCGSRYLFTVVDRSSRWLEALPMRVAAASCTDALIAGWISRYGVPAQLTSDRGTQFTSAIWDALCQQLGIQHQPTTAFHPQANGMVERCHRRLKDALPARLAGPDWPLQLP